MDANKENIDPDRARSILKHDDRTMPLMSSSRLDNSVRLAKRRVSFAPEVTLHKIDFVPQYSSRRETIGAIPQPEPFDGGREILPDSSDEEPENEMELTDQIKTSIVEPAAEQESQELQQEHEQEMELTESLPRIPVDAIYNDQFSDIRVETIEEEMELTQSLPRINIHSILEGPFESALVPSATQVSQTIEEIMDFTQSFSTIKPPSPTLSHIPVLSPVVDEVEMELTQSIANIRMQSPRRPARSSIGSESSVRQSLASESSVRSAASEGSVEPQFPEAELPIPDLETDSRKRSGDFDSPVAKSPKIAETTTIPLADTTNDSFEDDGTHTSVSLSDFLKDLGIRFYDDLEIDSSQFQRFSISGPLDSTFELSDYIKATNKLPLWSLFNFSNTELTKNIIDGKKLYQQLNDTILANNPKLFKEYYAASFNDQLTVKSEFLLIKEFSRLQARKVWYNWRSQLVENLIVQLEDKLDSIKSDTATLEESSKEVELILQESVARAEELKSKLARIKQMKQLLTDRSPEDIAAFRSELKTFKSRSEQFADDIRSKKQQLEEINTKIASNGQKLEEIKQVIREKERFLDENKSYEASEINYMSLKFRLLSKLNNLEFQKLDQKSISFLFDKCIVLDFFYETGKFTLTASDKHSFRNEWILKFVVDQSDITGKDLSTSFGLFKQKYQSLKQLDRELFAVSMRCPVDGPAQGSGLKFGVKYYDVTSGQKIQFEFTAQNDPLKFDVSAKSLNNKQPALSESSVLSSLKSACRSAPHLRSISQCTIDV